MKYPKKFYSYADGVKISNKTINEWINQCIEDLENDKTLSYRNTSTGNTIVQVNRQMQDDTHYNYYIMVCKNYEERESKVYEL